MHQAFFPSVVYASVLVNIYEGHRTPNVNSRVNFTSLLTEEINENYSLKNALPISEKNDSKPLVFRAALTNFMGVYEGIPHLPREECPHLPHLPRERRAL